LAESREGVADGNVFFAARVSSVIPVNDTDFCIGKWRECVFGSFDGIGNPRSESGFVESLHEILVGKINHLLRVIDNMTSILVEHL
jgi:hypothetical protein